MFSNILTAEKSPYSGQQSSSLKNIYHKFQNYLGRSFDNSSSAEISSIMSTARANAAVSEDCFVTPVSSSGDLLALSPNRNGNSVLEQLDDVDDLLTGSNFNSICDITMQEVTSNDDKFVINANSIDYLVKRVDSKRNKKIIDRGKESLFAKFDPLYAVKLEAEESKHTDSAPESECDVGYETESLPSINNSVETPKHTMSAGSIPYNLKEKPTQVVPPVIQSDVIKSTQSHTRSTPVLVRSVSAIITPSVVATDKLISITGNTPPTSAPRSPRHSHDMFSTQQIDRLQSLRGILQKQDLEVLKLRQENRELRSSLHDMEHNHSKTVEELNSKINKLTEDKRRLIGKETYLLEQINDKNLSYKQIIIVLEEYEKTISALIHAQQQDKIHIQEIIKEKDQAISHLSSMESSFNDLLTKYEKSKSVITEYKAREKVFEENINDYKEGLKKYETLYSQLKQISSESLTKANETLEAMKKSHAVEITKLNATIKKHEITISSLQESLAQKTRDNEELTRICDQLINEVR